jgi:hypothetical protein
MIVTPEMRSNFMRAVLNAYLGTMEKGTLGKKVPGNPAMIFVRGNAGNVWVTRQDNTVIQARVKGQITYEEDYPVEFRLENGTYIIYGRSVHPSLPVAGDPLLSGSFLSLLDTPDAYTGMAGKVVAVNALEDAVEFVDGGGATGAGEELEWLYLGGGDSAGYPGGYVGWRPPSGLWGGGSDDEIAALVLDITADYLYQLALVKDYGGTNNYQLVWTWHEQAIINWGIQHGAGDGPFLRLGMNADASTPAASHIELTKKNGNIRSIWIDAAGDVRVTTSSLSINNANDAAGTVVGTQTSSLDTKDVIGDPISGDDALDYIMDAARNAVKRFQYKVSDDGIAHSSRRFNGEEFSGIITDYAPRYGVDKDEEHPHGKSLNTINAIGDLMLAVTRLEEQVLELTARLEAMNGD